MEAGLGSAIPALPAHDLAAAVAWYEERLGFATLHHDDGYAVLRRDAAELHLWQADDESWRGRGDLHDRPVRSGGESFLAGTASCRIATADVDGLFAELAAADVLHPVSKGGVQPTDHGTREVDVLDLDGNLLTFVAG